MKFLANDFEITYDQAPGMTDTRATVTVTHDGATVDVLVTATRQGEKAAKTVTLPAAALVRGQSKEVNATFAALVNDAAGWGTPAKPGSIVWPKPAGPEASPAKPVVTTKPVTADTASVVTKA